MEGGDIQPEQPGFFERMGIRRTNETGEGAPSTGSLRGDLQALGQSLGFKKGGMIKPKTAMKKGGAVKKYQEGGRVNISELSDAELNRLGYSPGITARGIAKTQLEGRRRRRASDQEATKRNAYEDEATKELEESLGRGENAAMFMNEIVRSGGGMKKHKAAEYKKGGMVKAKAPAKMMKSGGKVAPKKMMKGGMTSKPKKMMGGGRAMYAKGGMAKGCK